MNILVVSDSFVPERSGGIAKTVFLEVHGFAARGHRVFVVSRRLHKDSPLHEHNSRYELHRYPAPPEGSQWNRLYPLFTLVALPRLIRDLCARHRFDIAYLHDYFQALAFEGMRLGIPTVTGFYASGYDELRIEIRHGKYGKVGSLAAWPMSWWMRNVQGRALDHADSVLVRSEYTRRRLLQLYPWLERSRISRIPLGVDTDRFQPRRDGNYRRRLGLPEGRPLLLSVRRLAGRMGLENLLLAMRQVARVLPEAFLVIAGKGYLEAKLRAIVEQEGLGDNVCLVGFMPESDLPDLYRAADLFVMPSEELEGFGLSTLEALACGVPVIATPVGANIEVLEGFGHEHFFAGPGADQIATGLIAWLGKGSDWELQQRCRQYCEHTFSQNIVSAALEDLFRRTIASRLPVNFTAAQADSLRQTGVDGQ